MESEVKTVEAGIAFTVAEYQGELVAYDYASGQPLMKLDGSRLTAVNADDEPYFYGTLFLTERADTYVCYVSPNVTKVEIQANDRMHAFAQVVEEFMRKNNPRFSK